ncbi:MAG: hypothetical protein IPO14_04555 [Saprospiraceae bacterium]|nr:hypothetical protein [Saprospiraceae bacterium]
MDARVPEEVVVIKEACGTLRRNGWFDTDNNNTQSTGETSSTGGIPDNANNLTGLRRGVTVIFA